MKKHFKLFIYLGITAILALILFLVSKINVNSTNDLPWYFSSLNINYNQVTDNTICIIDSGYSGDGFQKDNIIDCYNVFDGSTDVRDDFGHGTAMLSLVIGYEDETNKIYGINKKCKIVIIKAVDSQGYASADNVANAINYATKYPNSIINISLGTYIYNENLDNAVKEAIDKGCIIVAASGDDNKTDLMYPAKFDGVIAVTCQAKNGKKYIYANDNNKSLYVPGVNVDVCGFNADTNSIFTYSTSGSSISTIIFSAILSKTDLNLQTIDYEYLMECKCHNSFFNSRKIERKK